MSHGLSTRRSFLKQTLWTAAALPLACSRLPGAEASKATVPTGAPTPTFRTVAVVRCRSYGPEIKTALSQAFDLIGGIGSLVRGKTVSIKINLTGTNFQPFLGKPVGETYMTHESTAFALTALLFAQGAKRVRLLESTQSRSSLESTLTLADWDVRKFSALGPMEFENTRNLGSAKRYADLKVPNGGRLFSKLTVNHCYEETDVMVSLAKLKQHITAGITLSMKNLFGITPNSLYGEEAGTEEATAGRGPIHDPRDFNHIKLPGLIEGINSVDAGERVPMTVADICAARPIHLAVIDGVSTMSGGEGPWCQSSHRVALQTPGLLIVGRNPVSADAVGTAVMGFANPIAKRGTTPFEHCENHLQFAHQSALGTGNLADIEWVGLPLDQARHPFLT